MAFQFCESFKLIKFMEKKFVTEATQFCVTADSTLIKSVQSRELGQSAELTIELMNITNSDI